MHCFTVERQIFWNVVKRWILERNTKNVDVHSAIPQEFWTGFRWENHPLKGNEDQKGETSGEKHYGQAPKPPKI